MTLDYIDGAFVSWQVGYWKIRKLSLSAWSIHIGCIGYFLNFFLELRIQNGWIAYVHWFLRSNFGNIWISNISYHKHLRIILHICCYQCFCSPNARVNKSKSSKQIKIKQQLKSKTCLIISACYRLLVLIFFPFVLLTFNELAQMN